MVVSDKIEQDVRARSDNRDIGSMCSWRSIPILHIGPDGRADRNGVRFERFRIEFTSGLVVGGILSPETGHFAIQALREDEALSVAIARADELRDPGTEVAIFEAADYAVIGVLYLSEDVPMAITVKPAATEGAAFEQVVAEAYRR